jgi:hypothetical protein
MLLQRHPRRAGSLAQNPLAAVAEDRISEPFRRDEGNPARIAFAATATVMRTSRILYLRPREKTRSKSCLD